MYQWWVFVHLVGVFAFLGSHGVSMGVSFRLRTERDPQRVGDLLQLSGWAIRTFYVSLAVLLIGGIVAGFLGHWWSSAWIWASIVVLLLTSLAMYGLARPYYRRIRLVARAKAEGGTAVTDDQFDQILRSNRSVAVIGIGAVGLLVILYFMLFKPTFGVSSTAAPPPAGGSALQIGATALSFDTESLQAPADTPFTIRFDNAAPGVPHNVSVYRDSSAKDALFVGKTVTGPVVVTYRVASLAAGRYFFRCDVHPTLMTGTLVVK